MTRRAKVAIAMGAALVVVAAVGRWPTAAQTTGPAASRNLTVNASKFEFEIVESFDAKYLGDTPAHLGKNGGLEGLRPRVALGDPVFRDKLRIGHVTGIVWDRTKGALSVEFDPEPFQRVAVGDVVWVALDGSQGPTKPQ